MKTKLALAISSILALSACVDDYELSEDGEGFHTPSTVTVTGETYVGRTVLADIVDADGVPEEGVSYTWTETETYIVTENVLDDAGNVVLDEKTGEPVTQDVTYQRIDVIPGATSATYLIDEGYLDRQISTPEQYQETQLSVAVSFTDGKGAEEQAISDLSSELEPEPVQIDGSVAIDGVAFIYYPLEAVITDGNGTNDSEPTYVWMRDGVAIEGADQSSNEYVLTSKDLDALITVDVSYVDDHGFENNNLISAPTEAVTYEPPGTVKSQVAEIVDTDSGGSGVLRVKFAEVDDNNAPMEVMESGKISLQFSKDEVVFEGTNKEAYIVLFGGSTSTYDAMFDLRIGNGTYTVRAASGSEPSIELDVPTTFKPGAWVKVDLVWDASNATDTVGADITLYLDGIEVYSGKSVSPNKADLKEGVRTVNFKLSDTKSTPTGAFRIEDLKIFSDKAGETIFWEDNFDGYIIDPDNEEELPVDDVLSKANGGWNNSTSMATVIEVLVPEEEE